MRLIKRYDTQIITGRNSKTNNHKFSTEKSGGGGGWPKFYLIFFFFASRSDEFNKKKKMQKNKFVCRKFHFNVLNKLTDHIRGCRRILRLNALTDCSKRYSGRKRNISGTKQGCFVKMNELIPERNNAASSQSSIGF